MTTQKNPSAASSASQPSSTSDTKAAKTLHSGLDAAHNAYFQTVQEALQGMQKRLQEQQRTYQNAYAGIVGPSVPTAMQEAQNNLAKAQQEYVRACQDDGDAALKAASEAYKDYVRAIQKELAHLDVEKLEPRLLAAIGQSLIMVANAAYQARGTKAQ
jgi:hypothetical protein